MEFCAIYLQRTRIRVPVAGAIEPIRQPRWRKPASFANHRQPTATARHSRPLPHSRPVPTLTVIVSESSPARTLSQEPPAPGLLPLSRARAGATVIIRQLAASPDMNQRLREMGFSEDRQIKLLSLQANILCQVCNARLGLNQRLAECIWVEVIPTRRLH